LHWWSADRNELFAGPKPASPLPSASPYYNGKRVAARQSSQDRGKRGRHPSSAGHAMGPHRPITSYWGWLDGSRCRALLDLFPLAQEIINLSLQLPWREPPAHPQPRLYVPQAGRSTRLVTAAGAAITAALMRTSCAAAKLGGSSGGGASCRTCPICLHSQAAGCSVQN
jgi:hypothetical protein